jgi:hypothetical protein
MPLVDDHLYGYIKFKKKTNHIDVQVALYFVKKEISCRLYNMDPLPNKGGKKKAFPWLYIHLIDRKHNIVLGNGDWEGPTK